MTQTYSNPERASDPHALPDLEVWEDDIAEIECECGLYEAPAQSVFEGECDCPSCGRAATDRATDKTGWFYWFCFPGCLPDSDYHGPFDTEAGALADARYEE